MKLKCILTLSIGMFFSSFGANNSFALQVSAAGTYSCETQADCKKKCEDRGGRWRKDKHDKIHGTCTIKSTLTIQERILLLQDQLQAEKQRLKLYEEKRVFDWPRDGAKAPGSFAVEIAPSECGKFGGNAELDITCKGGVRCTASEVDPISRKMEKYVACISKLDGRE